MEDIQEVKKIIEALLIVSDTGLSKEDIKNSISNIDDKDIVDAIDVLKQEYEYSDRAFKIIEIVGKYRIVTKSDYVFWINKLYQKQLDRLSGVSMEVLAIIAYKQPITRAEVDQIRGVNSSGVLKSLLDKGLIFVKGRKDVIGKPRIYATTDKFLEIFGLNSLDELPKLKNFEEKELDYSKKVTPPDPAVS